MSLTQHPPRNLQSQNEIFQKQSRQYEFRFRCEHCEHLNHHTGLCSMDYPNHMLKNPAAGSREEDGRFVFCKYFELEGY